MSVWNEMKYEDVVAVIREKGCCAGKVNPTEYHSWKARLAEEFGCPVVSKSALHDFAENAYRYHYNLTHGVRKESVGFRMGSMVDTAVLTPELWSELYVHPWKPEGKYALPWTPWEPTEEKRFALKKNGEPSKNQDPEQKAEWEAAKAADKEAKEKFEQEIAEQKAAFEADCEKFGRTVLKDGEEERVQEIAEQAIEHLHACGLALGKTYQSQIGLFMYVDELDGAKLPKPLLVTGMIDICPDADSSNGGSLWDLKTTSKDPSAKDGLFYAIEDYRYGIQAALYIDMFNTCTGQERESFAFLFVGTVAPAMSCVVRLTAGDIDVFRMDYKALLFRYSTACAEDYWGEPTLPDAYYVPTRREAERFGRLMRGE